MRKKKTAVKKKARHDTSTKARKTIKRKRASPRKNALPKTRNGGTLTEAEYWQKVRQALRKSFRFWKPMMDALKDASRPSQSLNKRLKTEYQCAICNNWFPRTQVQIDHIIPCGSLNCAEDIPAFLEKLTREKTTDYQVLCKTDHAIKTNEEKQARKKLKI